MKSPFSLCTAGGYTPALLYFAAVRGTEPANQDAEPAN